MQVSHPLDRAYQFESTSRIWRLTYYVPPTKLRAAARKRLISDTVLRDYPYGIEVNVDVVEYGYLERLYRYVPPVHAYQARWAFMGLLGNVGPMLQVLGSGWINADRLEGYARSLSPFVEEWAAEIAQVEAGQAREAVAPEERDQQFRRLLLTHPPEGVNPEIPWDQQLWGKVRMSAGLSAIEIFNTVQQPKRSRKRGNRR